MAKLPGFMFYPGDWQKDPNLRRATRSEKGLLMDLLCLMFESGERGVLVSCGVPWADEEIVNAVSGDTTTTAHELAELVRKGVLSRRHDGALFSRRLVREEALRQIRSEAGSLGGRPTKYKKQHVVVEKSKIKANHKANTKQITEYENENERVVSKSNTRKANYEDVKAFCSELGLPDSDSDYFFHHWEGNGWTNGGKPIKNWKGTIRAWKAAGHLPSQKNGTTPAQVPLGMSMEDLEKKYLRHKK